MNCCFFSPPGPTLTQLIALPDLDHRSGGECGWKVVGRPVSASGGWRLWLILLCSLLSPVLPGCVQFLSVVQDHPPPPASPQHVLISSDIAINLPPSGAWWGGAYVRDHSGYVWWDAMCAFKGCPALQNGWREPSKHFDSSCSLLHFVKLGPKYLWDTSM